MAPETRFFSNVSCSGPYSAGVPQGCFFAKQLLTLKKVYTPFCPYFSTKCCELNLVGENFRLSTYRVAKIFSFFSGPTIACSGPVYEIHSLCSQAHFMPSAAQKNRLIQIKLGGKKLG